MPKSGLYISLVALVLLTLTSPAQAYLDPSNGSMLMQLLLGGAAGVSVLVKYYWHNIVSFFKRTPVKQAKGQD